MSFLNIKPGEKASFQILETGRTLYVYRWYNNAYELDITDNGVITSNLLYKLTNDFLVGNEIGFLGLCSIYDLRIHE